MTEIHVRAARITWWDAHSAGGEGWMPLSDVAALAEEGPCEVTTIGFLVEPSKPGHLFVLQTVNPEGEGYALKPFFIPSLMVQEVEFFDDPPE